jgi:hypothetical protein
VLPDSSKTLEPDALALLQSVFDSCLNKLEGVYGEEFTARRALVATRIMSLAQQGVFDPDQLEKQALAGLLPEYPY